MMIYISIYLSLSIYIYIYIYIHTHMYTIRHTFIVSVTANGGPLQRSSGGNYAVPRN